MSTDNSADKPKPALALLKSSARQNYERMKALLVTLEFYWAGVRYITAALMQKAEGVGTAGLDIAEEGPNVTLVTALNSKAKAARMVVPNDSNCECRAGLPLVPSAEPCLQGADSVSPEHSTRRRIKQ
jgi:hypothetical protein